MIRRERPGGLGTGPIGTGSAANDVFPSNGLPCRVSSWVSVGVLVVGLVLIVSGAELFFDALLVAAGRLGVSAFLLTVVVSGFELENLAAGIAANAKGLPDAAAGTFLGGTTFLALGVAGIGALLVSAPARPPGRALVWTALAGSRSSPSDSTEA